MKILITGANGFVGKALINRLLESQHEVVALVRSLKGIKNPSPKVTWIEGDVHKLSQMPQLKKIDKAFYLIHGLKEDAKNFEYQESLAAVNFIKWIKPTGADIIYLSGLGPRDKMLSPHLRSRHLTGAILGASGLATVEFRASIVLGGGSLSFEMIKAISERLPFRPDMTLLNQPCQPVALNDLLKYLEGVLDYKINGHEIIEIGAEDTLKYGELLDLYTELAGFKRKRLKLPDVEAKVLMKSLDYAIPELADIGKKLTETLELPTIVTDDSAKKAFPDIKPMSLRLAMDLARSESTGHYAPLWEKDFLKAILSDKILTQAGLFSPELLKNLEKVGKLKDLLSKK
jgi:uncharacterized protein YbjT (DUF2867 family)